jgi:Spy/CpxP family protein refolding chaperone
MKRRDLFMLSGAAVATGAAIAQGQPLKSASRAATQHSMAKTLVKYSRAKASYKLPKNDAKAAKYVSSLTAAFSLSPSQQQQALAIFSQAASVRAGVKGQSKAARKSLSAAVTSGDAAGISQYAAVIANLKAQRISAGANAHAAFYQLLTPAQQSQTLQFKA